jgi:hypothetical protein
MDPSLAMEKVVHANLGMKIASDTIFADPRAIMDELWGFDDSTQFNLNKKPSAEPKIEAVSVIQNKFARRANQDVKDVAPVNFERNFDHLKLAANREKIHAKLFK